MPTPLVPSRAVRIVLGAAILFIGSIIAGPIPQAGAATPCVGEVVSDIAAAKQSFARHCGRQWNDQVRDQCSWVNDPSGWVCHEYSPNGAPSGAAPTVDANSQQPSAPTFIQAQQSGAHISVIWQARSSQPGGVNVYRNGRYITTVENTGNVFSDFNGRVGDTYYLVAHDGNDNFSPRSAERRAVAAPRIDVIASRSNGRTSLTWSATGGVAAPASYAVHRIRPDGNGGTETKQMGLTRNRSFTATSSPGDLFVVLGFSSRNTLITTSGVQAAGGGCIASCGEMNVAEMSAASVVRFVVRGLWSLLRACANNPDDCGDIIMRAYEHFTTPDPAELGGALTISDLESDGWRIDESRDGGTTTMQRGADIMVVQAAPGSGRVVTTEVSNNGPAGELTRAEVTTVSVINSPTDSARVINTETSRQVEIRHHNAYTGELAGGYSESWRNGQLLSRDCYGSSGSSSCTTQRPLTSTPNINDSDGTQTDNTTNTDVDNDGIPDVRDPQIDDPETGEPDPDCRNC